MKIKCYYNKNLKMSPEKLSAQVGHVCMKISSKHNIPFSEDNIIVVLKASATKFNKLKEELSEERNIFVQKDLGLTEVDSGTETVFGYVEEF